MAPQNRIEGATEAGFGWLKSIGALSVFAAASVALFTELPSGHTSLQKVPAGKLVDRLSFVEEDVPTRETRIYDTLAMFSLPVSEAAAWAEPDAARADTVVTTASAATAMRVPSGMKGAVDVLPPIRPVQIASALPAPRPAAPAQIHPAIRTAASGFAEAAAPTPLASARSATAPGISLVASANEDLKLFGLDLPGTRYLPGPKSVETIGKTAREFGATARSAVTSTVSTVGDTLSDTFGFR